MTASQARRHPAILVETDDGVVTLTIARAERRNAIDHAMWRRIAAHLHDASRSHDTRAVIVTGAGVDFSAGADISEFDTVRGDAASAAAYEADNSAAFAALRNCPVPTIAAIRGVCLGGGFGLAAACDIRIADGTAQFAVPAAKLGLAYPVDAMMDIVTACGTQFATYLLASAARVDAARALAAGFLMEVTRDGEPLNRAREIAALTAANAPLSVRASKAAIRATATGEAEQRALAERLGRATFESADYKEGRAAFREGRKPRFRGR